MSRVRDSVLRLGTVKLTSDEVVNSAKTGAITLAASTVVLVIVAALASLVLGPDGHTGSPHDWFRAGVALLGLGVHSPLQASLSAGFLLGDAQATVSLTMSPLLVTGFLVLSSAWFAGRAEQARPTPAVRELVARSAVTSAAFAMGATVLSFLMGGGPGYGYDTALVGAEVHLNGWLVFLGGFLVCFAGGLFGRCMAVAARRDSPMTALVPARLESWVADGILAARLLGATFVAVFAGCTLLLLYGIVAGSLSSSSSVSDNLGVSAGSASEWFAAIGALLVLLPNLLIWGTGLAMGSPVSGSVTGEASALSNLPGGTDELTRGLGLLTGDAPGRLYLLPVLVFVFALSLGLWSLLRRAPGQGSEVRLWRVCGIYAAAWLVLAELTRVRIGFAASGNVMGNSAGASGALVVGLGLFAIACCAVFWALVATWGADLVGRPLATVLPGMMLRLGGRRIHPGWRLLLVQALAAHGKALPSATEHEDLTAAAEAPLAPLPVDPRRDRRIMLVAGSVLALVALSYVGLQVMNNVAYGPASAVEDYFGHVADHDAEGALALIQGVDRAEVDRTLLTSKAMTDPPRNVTVSTVDVGDETATAVVSETLAGRSHTATVSLRKDGKVHGIFDRWLLVDPVTLLTVETGRDGQTVTVNGVPVSAGDHLVFPGRYKVGTAKSGFWLASEAVVDASGGDAQTVTMQQSPDPRLQQAANQAVHKYIDDCAAQSVVSPTGCGSMTYYAFGELKNVKWTVLEYPTVSAQPSQTDDTVSLTVETPGRVRFTAIETSFFGDPTKLDEVQEIGVVDGALTWDGGTPSTATISQPTDFD